MKVKVINETVKHLEGEWGRREEAHPGRQVLWTPVWMDMEVEPMGRLTTTEEREGATKLGLCPQGHDLHSRMETLVRG